MHPGRVTCWMGGWSHDVLGPFFFEQMVNVDSYLSMLENDVLLLLQNILEFNDGSLFWMQDDAPPHWAQSV